MRLRLRTCFPTDPWMRRERMAIAAFLCVCCLLASSQFAVWALASYAPPFPQGRWLALMFGCAALAFFLFAMGFVCSFLIKLPGVTAQAFTWKSRGQRAAYAFLLFGFALALLWSVLLVAYRLAA
jgi:hypothetical protein